MSKKLAFQSAIAALAMALTLGHATLGFAADQNTAFVDPVYAGYEESAEGQESDDIYAVLNPEARHGGPHPGGPPPGGGGGYGPPPGGGYGPGGGGYGPPPGRGWGRGVQCKAVNARGVPFYGQGRNVPEARDAALWKCERRSRRCFMDGCNPI